MKSFTIRIAELNIKINCLYDLAYDLCRDYLVDEKDIDFEINIKEEDLEKFETNTNEYKDFMAILDAISLRLGEYNKVLVHGAAIDYNGLGFLFIALSGTGKSTHIKMWKESLEGVTIVNGDKPIIDNNGYMYGTPWCGKERWNTNTKTKLNSVIVLQRDSINHIERVRKEDYIKEILNSIDRRNINNMNIIDNILKQTKLYKLGCNTNKEAVDVCRNGLLDENK